MKVKITKITAKDNTRMDKCDVPYNCTAIRCHLHSDAEIAALSTAIYEINTKYKEKGNIHISRSARYVSDDGSFTTDLMIAYSNISSGLMQPNSTNIYKIGDKVIHNGQVLVATNVSSTNVNTNIWVYNRSINHILLKHGIDFEFIDFESIEHNVDDAEFTSMAYHIIFDRAILNNEFFEAACKRLGFEDVDDIECIHIPLNKAYVTRKLSEGTIDSDGHKNVCETKNEYIEKNDKTKTPIMNFNIAIFDKENSDAFDKLIMGICSKAVIDITADYTEANGNKFFRTVYMKITDDPAGRSLYTTACHYGCANITRDNT